MNETIQALKDSIKHWENLRDGKETEYGEKECALCRLFFSQTRCRGCPVHRKTGEVFCLKTPFRDYCEDETTQNAQREVDFLKDVLIEELEGDSKKPESPPKEKKFEFKVGDIVEYSEYGLGIIKVINTTYDAGVEFFKLSEGCHDLRAHANSGHGYWVVNDNLKLVYRPK